MKLTVEQVARVIHEANRAVQQITGDRVVSPEWLAASKDQRDAAMDGVEKALDGTTPEELHDNWCEWKISNGWKYGRVKDEFGKTHPCLIPYSELPEEQKVKDRLFIAVVQTLAPYV